MLSGGEYSPSETEPFSCLNSVTASRKKKNKNKRRFSDEQIKSLETMFESETRLEPRKKMQLARELGLQPRQVAIWFQNKRARWRSKQLEGDYSILRANYNSLASQFETLKKEKQALAIQLQKLNDPMKKPGEEGEFSGQGAAVNRSEGEYTTKGESDMNPRLSNEQPEHGLGVLSYEDNSIKAEYFELEEPNIMSMVEPADGSLTSQEDWVSLDSDGLFDQSSSGYQWWDFWA